MHTPHGVHTRNPTLTHTDARARGTVRVGARHMHSHTCTRAGTPTTQACARGSEHAHTERGPPHTPALRCTDRTQPHTQLHNRADNRVRAAEDSCQHCGDFYVMKKRNEGTGGSVQRGRSEPGPSPWAPRPPARHGGGFHPGEGTSVMHESGRCALQKPAALNPPNTTQRPAGGAV